MFSPKEKRGSESAHFVQKQMISREIGVKTNLWPKALCIPRNSAQIQVQDKRTNLCLSLCCQNMLFKMCNTGRGE